MSSCNASHASAVQHTQHPGGTHIDMAQKAHLSAAELDQHAWQAQYWSAQRHSPNHCPDPVNRFWRDMLRLAGKILAAESPAHLR